MAKTDPPRTPEEIVEAADKIIGGEYLNDIAAAFRPVPGVEFAGRFVRLERGPEYEFAGRKTRPIIAVFQMDKGQYLAKKTDTPTDVTPGEEYALWLIHTVALDKLKELRPEVGELVAGVYDGEKVKRGMEADHVAGKRGTTYHAWRFVCPDRPTAVLSWDSIVDTADDVIPF